MSLLQLRIWQARVVAKPLSCGVARLKAKALLPCSDVLHSKTGFIVSMTNQNLCDKLFRERGVKRNLILATKNNKKKKKN